MTTIKQIFYNCSYISIGPLAGFLITKLGHRMVASAGIVLTAIGYIGLAYSTTLTTMILFHGIPSGTFCTNHFNLVVLKLYNKHVLIMKHPVVWFC